MLLNPPSCSQRLGVPSKRCEVTLPFLVVNATTNPSVSQVSVQKVPSIYLEEECWFNMQERSMTVKPYCPAGTLCT